MFIYSLRASTLKFFTVTSLALIALVTLLFFIPADAGTTQPTSLQSSPVSGEIRYDKIKSPADRIAFLSQFGWEVEPEPVEATEVTIPAEFDKVFKSYNELQKSQGFDLADYRKKTLMRYTYKITNYEGYEGDVLVSILVHKNRVVAADICSADVNGFIHGLEK